MASITGGVASIVEGKAKVVVGEGTLDRSK